MSAYLGDFAEDALVHFSFTTNAADGGRESLSATLEEADIVIYQSDGDGTFTAMTLDASSIIITHNPGSQVGVYLVGVDMSNDADFTTGKDYIAVLYASDETVDSQNIAGVLAHWSCENRGVQSVRGNVAGSVASVTGAVGSVTGAVGSVTGGINTGAGTITTLDGLDTAQDTQHSTTQGKVDTAQADLDTLTGSDGAKLATSQPNYAPAVAGDQMDLVNAPNATAITAIQTGLSTAAKLLAYVQLLARSDSAIATDNATELAEINANGGSGAGDFANASEALEALRDWIGNGTNLTEAGGTGDQFTALPTLAQILAGGDVDGFTIEQSLKIILAALAGKLSGAATTTVTVRAADDSKDRITATVDASGNRSAVTLDGAG